MNAKEGVCGAEGLPKLLGSCMAHGLEDHGFKEGVPMLPGLTQTFIPPRHIPFRVLWPAHWPAAQ